MIPDILIGCGAIGFLIADIKQAIKIHKNSHYDKKIISRTHWKVKISSIIMVIVGYVMIGLVFAIVIALLQLIFSLYIMSKIGWKTRCLT
jgi:uncharacterized membrane protein